MSIETRHPDFRAVEQDYRIMRDTFAGQRTIKEGSTVYLPMTSGMVEDGGTLSISSAGYQAYQAYLTRAVFPEVVREAVNILVGVMHREPPDIQLPEVMEPMRARATRKNDSLEMLLRRINEQQMLFGRYGLLADVAARAATPHLVGYGAESIINWDDERFDEMERERLSFLVLNETTQVRGAVGADIFDWMEERRFRVAVLEALNEEMDVSDSNPLTYKTWTEIDEVRSDTITPSFRGRTLQDIPWVFIGANDLFSKPDEIPLLGLANLALTIYRGEADYRQTAFMLGQDTLVVIGDEDNEDDEGNPKATRVGAGAKISVPIGGDAKFIGVESRGMPEQAKMLSNDYTRAREMGSRLLEPRGSQAESGEALRIRVAAQTSTLTQIALTGAAGLEQVLRSVATWMGADPEQVIVKPNLDFADTREEPGAPAQLMEAKLKGAPLSMRSIHRWLQENDFTRMGFDEEQRELSTEPPIRVQGVRGTLTADSSDDATVVEGEEDETGTPTPEDGDGE